MTETPNTAAIRALYEDGGVWPEHVYALVNALDAARAERDISNKVAAQTLGYLERAEAAEATVQAQAVQIHSMFGDCRELRARAEAAEAELAAIKRTDMHPADVRGMLSNAHAATELMRERRDHYIARAEVAEARIGAALAIDDGLGCCNRARSVLTEGTGQ